MKIFSPVINALFPNKCISCGEIIPREDVLCDYCFELLEHSDLSKNCLHCGYLKKECHCKYHVFHFSGCTAPFENKGVAKNVMYRFKFGRTMRAAKFCAFEMAKAVKTSFGEIDFDYIAYVPMHFLKRLKRGFNQAQLISQKLAEILGISVYENLLSVKYSRKVQHNAEDVKERFANVRDIYNCNYNITGKTILLVDDIKTTGATLDACAKQLLLAGANSVYCVTGLTSKSKKGKK